MRASSSGQEGPRSRRENGFPNPLLPLLPFLPPGSSECVNGWRGLSPLVLNPHFGTALGISLIDQITTQWTHSGDAIQIYGTAPDGFAASTWDNVGVQYGLGALVGGDIDTEGVYGGVVFSPPEFMTGRWKISVGNGKCANGSEISDGQAST